MFNADFLQNIFKYVQLSFADFFPVSFIHFYNYYVRVITNIPLGGTYNNHVWLSASSFGFHLHNSIIPHFPPPVFANAYNSQPSFSASHS